MNIFRSLIGKVWQDPNAAEVVKISSGQLYLLRPGNIRSPRECIYNDAMATIRRIPNVEHNFQLVVTRVYEDGDQELLEDEDETDEERVFLISDELQFRLSRADGEPAFLWRDLHGDEDELFEYVAAGTNEPTLAFFETCMYRAMYERKYRRSADHTQDADFEEFIWRPPVARLKAPPLRKGTGKASPAEAQSTQSPLITEEFPKGHTKLTKKVLPQAAFHELISHEAELYFWEPDVETFTEGGLVTAKILQSPTNQYEFWLAASNTDHEDVIAHKISSEMNQRWSHKMFSLTWNYFDEIGRPQSALFRFTSQESFSAFLQAFTQALWETLNEVSWSKAKPDEQNYVMSSTEDVEMQDIEDEEEDEEVFSELDPEAEASESEEDEEEDDELPALSSTERNSQLTVGYRGDRSYVVRGSNIGVFNHSADSGVKYYATISKLSTQKGKEFKPKHVMLHDQDTKMIIMNPSESHSLFSMDIERGKIVEEWKVHEDISVDYIAPENKFAPTTREQTVVGASHNALFRIDPRISGTKLVESQFKQYVSKNKFSGVTTTAAGKLAVVSEKGDIRLFDSIGKNAKTALPPLGDPIIGVDVTADGRWIVATTKTYLLLVDTLIGEGRYAGNLGFDRSFPANAKPIPRRLQLRSEHVAYMGHNVSFTPARFNQGEGQVENAIVTSTGQYVVAWDFNKVKRGRLDVYEIKKYEDYVVQDNFRFGDDKEIVVALQNNVLSINKKNLKRPTRHSLAPASRSNIVNSPF
ncbi:hypothetical protein AX16_003149 [Volvariella volvacea WC 439]|nr:hypothetical protein AX16_003149 [Volvariella volvacea WC 439]